VGGHVLKKLAIGAVAIIVGIIVADNVPEIGGHMIAVAVWAIAACAIPAKSGVAIVLAVRRPSRSALAVGGRIASRSGKLVVGGHDDGVHAGPVVQRRGCLVSECAGGAAEVGQYLAKAGQQLVDP
jgi:hypothetical protein